MPFHGLTQRQMAKIGTSALVGAGATAAMKGAERIVTIPRLGTTIPLYVAGGIASGVSSAASSIAHNNLQVMVESDKWSDMTASSLALITSGGAGMGAWYLMDPQILAEFGVGSAVGVAVVAEVAGSFLVDSVVMPMMA